MENNRTKWMGIAVAVAMVAAFGCNTANAKEQHTNHFKHGTKIVKAPMEKTVQGKIRALPPPPPKKIAVVPAPMPPPPKKIAVIPAPVPPPPPKKIAAVPAPVPPPPPKKIAVVPVPVPPPPPQGHLHAQKPKFIHHHNR